MNVLSLSSLVLTAVLTTAPPADPSLGRDAKVAPEELAGGATTVFDTTSNAFGRAVANLQRHRWPAFREGKTLFFEEWTAPGAVARPRDGLGPLLNATSCAGCHFKDGRGRPAADGGVPLLARLAVAREDGSTAPHPLYGVQLQDRAVPGAVAEGRLVVTYTEVAGRFPSGESYSLRRPAYRIVGAAHGALGSDTRISPRMPPAVMGVGLLEAIPEAAILALEDPEDRDRDGISGRANRVSVAGIEESVLGRFGWKASQPTVARQNAAAFRHDLGVTTPFDPGTPELATHELRRVSLYTRLLAVPARRGGRSPAVLAGKALFMELGCAGCHEPRFTTGAAAFPELAGQTIWPYSDLLLHDMGEELADGRGDGEADGREWRTAPLWGLGLHETVGGVRTLLHDGRARTPEEAILWHGGEAAASRRAYRRLSAERRQAVLVFLESL